MAPVKYCVLKAFKEWPAASDFYVKGLQHQTSKTCIF